MLLQKDTLFEYSHACTPATPRTIKLISKAAPPSIAAPTHRILSLVVPTDSAKKSPLAAKEAVPGNPGYGNRRQYAPTGD
jgi:hypothetical protein